MTSLSHFRASLDTLQTSPQALREKKKNHTSTTISEFFYQYDLE
jgi:hypothetical protein